MLEMFPYTLQSPHPSLTPLTLRSLRYGSGLAVIVASACGDTLALSLQRVAGIGYHVAFNCLVFYCK